MKKYKSSSNFTWNSNHKGNIRNLNIIRLKVDGEKERKDYREYQKAQIILRDFNDFTEIREDEKRKSEVDKLRMEIYRAVVIASSYEQIAKSGVSYPPIVDIQKFITEEAMKNLILAFFDFIIKSVLMDDDFYEQLEEIDTFRFWNEIFLELEEQGNMNDAFIDFFMNRWNRISRDKKIILFTMLSDLVHHSGNILRDFLGFLYTNDLKKFLKELEKIF